MNYKSPLRIFSPEEIKILSVETLASLKKKHLLLFQLTDESVVNLNGHWLDKNQVIESFEEIKRDFEIHLKIYRNKSLYHFLESGDFNSFPSLNQIQEFISDPFIEELLSKKIRQDFFKIMISSDFSRDTVIGITEYLNTVNSRHQDIAYGNMHSLLTNHIEGLSAPTPARRELLEFPEDLVIEVSHDFYLKLCSLPNSFESVRINYSDWCGQSIINPAILSGKSWPYFETHSLKIIAEAYKIHFTITNNPKYKERFTVIEDLLVDRSNVRKRVTTMVLITLALPIIILSLFHYLDSRINELTPASAFYISKHHPPYLKNIAPCDFTSLVDSIESTEVYDNHVKINAVLNNIPFDFSCFSMFLTDSVRNKFTEEKIEVHFNFRIRDISNSSFSHKFLFDPHGKELPEYFMPTLDDTKNKLTIKNASKNTQFFLGHISVYNDTLGMFQMHEKIRLKRRDKNAYLSFDAVIKVKDNKEHFYSFELYWNHLDDKYEAIDVLNRVNGLGANFNLLNKKEFDLKRYYWINDLSSSINRVNISNQQLKSQQALFVAPYMSSLDGQVTATASGRALRVVYLLDPMNHDIRGMDVVYYNRQTQDVYNLVLFRQN